VTKKQLKTDTAARVPTGQTASEIETLSNTEPFLTMTDQLNVASPDVFCRTGLFGASAARERVLLEPNEKVVVACDPATGYQVELEGGLNCNIPGPLGAPLRGQKVSSRLDQADYTVYLGLLRLTRGMLGATVVLEPYAFVKTLGLDDTKPNVYSTFKAIARMNATRLTVVQPKHGHPGKFVCCVGYLVSSIAYDSSSQTYTIALDPQLAGLFQKSYFNQLAWQQRLALSTSLSRWLHAELNSHRSGYRRWSHLLQQAFGSQSPERVFRTRLREAVVEVCKVTGWDIRLEENDANYNLKLVCFKAVEDATSPEVDESDPSPAPATALRRPTQGRNRPAPPAANQGEFSFAMS
jgi:hypothetical protein